MYTLERKTLESRHTSVQLRFIGGPVKTPLFPSSVRALKPDKNLSPEFIKIL